MDDMPEVSLAHKHEWTRPLAREFSRAMRKPTDKQLERMPAEWRALAEKTMDFVIDVESGAHVWGGYERRNLRLFGTALPVTGGDPGEGLTRARAVHFLWKMLSTLLHKEVFPPTHPDVVRLTDVFLAFWDKRRKSFRAKDSYRLFVAGPNDVGWRVKRKLITLGQSCYFFRPALDQYLDENPPELDGDLESMIKASANTMDDFLCQVCTGWSGMGATDLLAEVLDFPEARRDDIRAWNDRHISLYRIDAVSGGRLTVTNIPAESEYRVRIDEGAGPFHVGMVLFGALAPWGGEWRWSGLPTTMGDIKKEGFDLDEVRRQLKRMLGSILCRSWPEYLEECRKEADDIYRKKLAFHDGRDFVVFENSWAYDKDEARFNGEDSDPWFTSHDVDDDEEVALYTDPLEGDRIFFRFTKLRNALAKKGVDLTAAERSAAVDFITSPYICADFVKKVLEKYPADAFMKLCGAPDEARSYWLDWLLRCYKGVYYRTRYPLLEMDDDDE